MDFGRIWAEIDLDALNHNLDQVRGFSQGRKLMFAVKADAYGHGLNAIAGEVADKVDAFGVAGVEEGKSLRRSGIKDTPIIVLSPVPYDEVPDLFEHDLTPSVTEPEFAQLLSNEAENRGRPLPVHIEVDTGMGRTGVSVEEALMFITNVAEMPGLRLEGVFTHFPAADTDIPYTEDQLSGFTLLFARLEQDGFGHVLRHAANSAGLMNLPHSHLDMIRPGLIVYGILPPSYDAGERDTDLDLSPVMSLRTRIVNLRDIPAGHSVSYDRSYFTRHDSRIAVVAAGYGDGYPWSLTNKGQAIVRGERVPIVGNVCMDLTMLDVTGHECAIGDPVTLMGRDDEAVITTNEIAGWAGTIPYEIICRVSPRVPRIYIRNNEVVKVRNMLNRDES